MPGLAGAPFAEPDFFFSRNPAANRQRAQPRLDPQNSVLLAFLE
jgi:hypothetical protein